jgi:uncharacterized protein (DUF58 family)
LLSAFAGLLLHPRAFVVGAAAAAILLLGVAGPWLSLRGVRGTLWFPQRRAEVGGNVAVRLKARGGWPWHAYGLLVRAGWVAPGDSSAGEDLSLSVARLSGWGWSEFSWTLPAPRRGVYPLAPVAIVTRFPFGFWEARRTIASQGQVTVWPRIVRLPAVAGLGGWGGPSGEIPGRRAGAAGSISGVRPYQPGEPLRRVHWQQTARHDRLIVCERSQTVSAEASLIVETHAAVYRQTAGDDLLEEALSVAATLAKALVESGCRVRLQFDALGNHRAETVGELASMFDALARFSGELPLSLPPFFRQFDRNHRLRGRQVVLTTIAGVARCDPHDLCREGRRFVAIASPTGPDEREAAVLRTAGTKIAVVLAPRRGDCQPPVDHGKARLLPLWRELAYDR